jgi:hypothetical protein
MSRLLLQNLGRDRENPVADSRTFLPCDAKWHVRVRAEEEATPQKTLETQDSASENPTGTGLAFSSGYVRLKKRFIQREMSVTHGGSL